MTRAPGETDEELLERIADHLERAKTRFRENDLRSDMGARRDGSSD
jgi:predicted small metal-binding protein